MATEKTLLPSRDVGLAQWRYDGDPGAGLRWSMLVDPDSNMWYHVGKNGEGDIHELGFETAKVVPASITSIKLYIYTYYTSYECFIYWKNKGQIYFQDAWSSIKEINNSCGYYSWQYVEWTGLSGSQKDLDGLKVRLIAPGGDMGLLDYVRIKGTYIVVTADFIAEGYMPARKFIEEEPIEFKIPIEGRLTRPTRARRSRPYRSPRRRVK